MKQIILLLTLFISIGLKSQKVVYTDNPKDKRLFAYRDSLREYKDYVKYKDYILKRISTFVTFTQYDNFIDSIKQVENKSKCDPTSTNKWELISSIESRNGLTQRKLWIGKSDKPYVIVKYVPKPTVIQIDTFVKSHVIYQTKNIEGKITIDSSKTFKKLVAIN